MSGLRRVLFLVDNVPLELDSRVQREAGTLAKAGIGIAVICPAAKGEPWYELDEGMHVYRYPKPALGAGLAGHIAEYVAAVVAHFVLSVVVAVRHGFDVVHVGNPPDLLSLAVAPHKALGKRFVFDHHDLVPELFTVRYADRFPWLMRSVLAAERASFRLADQVITTNESFRRVAIERGGVSPDDVTVVRNGPRLEVDFPPAAPDRDIRAHAELMVGYLGNMNDQDDLDVFIEMARIIRHELERTDLGFVMVGSGDAFSRLVRLRDAYGLQHAVLMPGRLPWDRVLATLAATDICVQPDLPNGFNRMCTMNKLMEYMALSRPCVAFDMPETRTSGGDAVVYVDRYDAQALAETVVALADDAGRRRRLGELARSRIETELAWEHQEHSLLRVYERLAASA
jgi:glycosyltransferase involved in cell wall biosynthesis